MEKAHTTPKDFFLFAGAIIALYGSIASFLVLMFTYINRAFPDAAAPYYDAYTGGVRFAMASLIVLAPLAAVLYGVIRRGIQKDPSKEHTAVRRFALVLTLFLAGGMVVIDLITLLTTFLGGELTLRFVLKVLVTLLVGALVGMHVLADSKGYWIAFPKRSRAVEGALAILALVTVIAGFFIIGTPGEARKARLDNQRVSHLVGLQQELTFYWQQKGALPETLDALADPIRSFMVFEDPATGAPYEYERTGDMTFRLCATFDTDGERSDMRIYNPMEAELWAHQAERTCFERVLDEELHAPYPKPVF